MVSQKRITFNSLALSGAIAGIIPVLIHYFWLAENPNVFLSFVGFAVFNLVYLTFMCWTYEINPLRGKFSSPFKDK